MDNELETALYGGRGLLAAGGSLEQDDRTGHAGIEEGRRLTVARDPESVRVGQRLRHRDQTVSVGIGLENSDDLRAPRRFPQPFQVVSERAKADDRPSGETQR